MEKVHLMGSDKLMNEWKMIRDNRRYGTEDQPHLNSSHNHPKNAEVSYIFQQNM